MVYSRSPPSGVLGKGKLSSHQFQACERGGQQSLRMLITLLLRHSLDTMVVSPLYSGSKLNLLDMDCMGDNSRML